MNESVLSIAICKLFFSSQSQQTQYIIIMIMPKKYNENTIINITFIIIIFALIFLSNCTCRLWNTLTVWVALSLLPRYFFRRESSSSPHYNTLTCDNMKWILIKWHDKCHLSAPDIKQREAEKWYMAKASETLNCHHIWIMNKKSFCLAAYLFCNE